MKRKNRVVDRNVQNEIVEVEKLMSEKHLKEYTACREIAAKHSIDADALRKRYHRHRGDLSNFGSYYDGRCLLTLVEEDHLAAIIMVLDEMHRGWGPTQIKAYVREWKKLRNDYRIDHWFIGFMNRHPTAFARRSAKRTEPARLFLTHHVAEHWLAAYEQSVLMVPNSGTG